MVYRFVPMVELGAISLKCPRTIISPRYDYLTNGKTVYRT